MPAATDWSSATPVTSTAPMVAPTSGIRSVTATTRASASAYFTPTIDRKIQVSTPAITEMRTLPAT